MIKINLLPPHILEGRRVKLVAVAMGLLVAVVVVAMAGWIWLAPGSLTSKVKQAQEELTKVTAEAEAVQATEAEAAEIEASYGAKSGWVGFVDQADGVPMQWVRWFQRVNRYVPSEVALSSLPAPTGASYTLTGNTSDFRAANRWYLNMLRCEMLDSTADPQSAVQINVGMPDRVDAPGTGGDNPRMAFPVTLAVMLDPRYVEFATTPVPVPAGMGGGGGGRGGGGGGRMGGGRGGGGGGRGGGMRGGGGGRRGGGGGRRGG